MVIATDAERAFYHSFPRVKPSDTEEFQIAKGLAILKAVRDVGLVLAPEIVEWSIPQIDGTTKVIRNRQVRICFTELSLSELPGHAKTFGPFSMEFDIEALRQFGILPVIYVPQMVKGDRLLSSFGPVIVWMLENARGTMDLLEQLRAMSDPVDAVELARKIHPEVTRLDPKCVLTLHNVDEKKKLVNQFTIQASVVRQLLQYLNYRTAPFANMRGAIWAAQNLFYPTDDHVNDKALSYYRQREWRIIPGGTVEGKTVVRLPTDSEKKFLLGLDERFWSRELGDDKGTFQRIAEAQVIDEYRGKHISDCVRRVVAPKPAFERARELFGERVEMLTTD